MTHKSKRARPEAEPLVLSDTLRLHPDVLIGNGNGVFGAGSPGSGKSVAFKLLLEQIAQKANIPMVVFDREEDVLSTVELFPRGVIATFKNCPTARDIYNDGLQVVFNLSTWPDMDKAGEMIARMVNALMREAEGTPMHLRVPCLIGMDEASYWLPQQRGDSLDKDTYRQLKDAFEAVATRGRKRGLVPFLFTQKFSGINKDVLSPGTYILMKQVTHTEQERYLDYILPIGEFLYFNDRQKKLRIGDLRTGEAIVRLATGEQQVTRLHHCQSEHHSHTPKTETALVRYARVEVRVGARFGAYIEDKAMDLTEEDELEEDVGKPVKKRKPPKKAEKPAKKQTRKLPEVSVIEPRVRKALSENPNINNRELAKVAKCSYSDAPKWRARVLAQMQPVTA